MLYVTMKLVETMVHYIVLVAVVVVAVSCFCYFGFKPLFVRREHSGSDIYICSKEGDEMAIAIVEVDDGIPAHATPPRRATWERRPLFQGPHKCAKLELGKTVSEERRARRQPSLPLLRDDGVQRMHGDHRVEDGEEARRNGVNERLLKHASGVDQAQELLHLLHCLPHKTAHRAIEEFLGLSSDATSIL